MSSEHLPEYRRQIHDAIIADFRTLQHEDGTTLFKKVGKILIEKELSSPICQVLPFNVNVTEDGLEENQRVFGFRAIVTENLEKIDNSLGELAIDRISRAEDIVLEYLEKEPHPLDAITVPASGAIPEYTIQTMKISNIQGQWIPQVDTTFSMSLDIRFSVYISLIFKV